MILAIWDVMCISLTAVGSMFYRSARLTHRSWRAEMVCRLARRLLDKSLGKPASWLRQRQSLLVMIGANYFKVNKVKNHYADVPCVSVYPKYFEAHATHVEHDVIVYFHGGGYVVGSAKGYTNTLAEIACRCQAKVIGVEYRLAPEHPVPAAQEDCLAVVEEVLARKQAQQRVILMGDSAGGGLVLSVLNALVQADREKAIDLAVLISPWAAPYAPERLSVENEAHDLVSEARLNTWVTDVHVVPDEGKQHIDFRDTDFSLFPPVYIQSAGAEILIGQVHQLVEEMQRQNVDVQHDSYPDMFHVFQTLSPLVPEADAALNAIARRVGT